MLKLISVNIEKDRHYDTILPFFDKEDADVICLQEVAESFATLLKKRGYFTYFAPMTIFNLKNEDERIGIMTATKLPQLSRKYYYLRDGLNIIPFDSSQNYDTSSRCYIMSQIKTKFGIFNIATTHMIDTGNGRENPIQIEAVTNMLKSLHSEPDHIFCGDFNIPRGFNNQYEVMTAEYLDNIPNQYKSSLDKNLHRLGKKELDVPIFDKYMVDYVFTKPPYVANDVRLEFGVSDHAAVVVMISKDK